MLHYIFVHFCSSCIICHLHELLFLTPLFCVSQHCKVTAHWHKGTTFMIQFDESVIARDKAFDAR